MNILYRRKPNRSLFFVRTAFKRPNPFVTRFALGVCAVLIGLVPSTTVAAQPGGSVIATLGYIHGISGEDSDRGGPAASVGAFFRISPVIDLGVSLAYYGLGTHTTFISDFLVPGGSYQEDYTINMLDVDLSCRLRKASGSIRPYATIGGGVVIKSSKDTIVVKDASGSLIPGYQFFESRSGSNLLIVLGAGVDFPHVLGPLGIGINGRWRMIPGIGDEGLGFAHYLTISIGISIN